MVAAGESCDKPASVTPTSQGVKVCPYGYECNANSLCSQVSGQIDDTCGDDDQATTGATTAANQATTGGKTQVDTTPGSGTTNKVTQANKATTGDNSGSQTKAQTEGKSGDETTTKASSGGSVTSADVTTAGKEETTDAKKDEHHRGRMLDMYSVFQKISTVYSCIFVIIF